MNDGAGVRAGWALRWLGVCALLAACGGGGGGGEGGGPAPIQPPPADGPAALNAYFPTTAGSRWYYERTDIDGVRGQLAVEAGGTTTVAGRNVTVLSATDSADGSTETRYFSTTADGVREHSGPGSDADGTGLESYVLLRLPASTPAPYLQYELTVSNPSDVDGDGRPDTTRLRSVVRTSTCTAPVVTTAGRFDDCVQQRVELTASFVLTTTGATLVVNQVSDDFYVRGVGLVQSVATYTSQGRSFNERIVLQGFVVGDVRSEQVAPTVLLPTAPVQAVRGQGLDVVVRFSEAMYAPSLTDGALALLDAQDRRVPGSITVSGSEAHFRPDAVPPSGSYRLVVDTRARDLVGNALAAAASFAVLVDSDGPGVLRTLPADGATGVRPDVRVEVTLSEVPASGLDLARLRLLDAQGQAVPADVLLVDRTLQLQPRARLQAGARYVLSLGPGLSDSLGNVSGTAVESSFTVDPDGQAPRLLRMEPPDGSVEVAPDTVIRLYFDEPLAAPLTGLAIAYEFEGSPFIADLTATLDGSVITLTPRSPMPQDAVLRIVVGGVSDALGNTGTTLQNLRVRTVTSRFAPVTTLALDSGVTATAIGDLNGDGRADQALVTAWPTGFSGLDSYKLIVRLGAAGGGRGDPQALPLPLECRMEQVQVVDLDADGRNDVLVSGRGCGVWVYAQQGDGTLGAPQRLPGLDFLQVQAVDMDGDGRAELVGVSGSQLGVWARNGSGTWTAGAALTLAAPQSRHFVVGDLNGDGRPDVAVALDNDGRGPHLAVCLQAGGGFGSCQLLMAPYEAAWQVAIGDIDGDGRADLVATVGGNRPRAALAIWPQRPDGSLGNVRALPVYEIPQNLQLADIDGDGRLDAVVGHGGFFRIGVLLQAGGGLAAELLYPARADNGTGALAVGDLDGDGRADIAMGEQALIQRVPPAARPAAAAARPHARPLKAAPVGAASTWQRVLPRATGRVAR